MSVSPHTDPDPATAGPGHTRYEVQGREVRLPVHIAHARAGLALMTAHADAVAADLPAGLAPVLLRPGRTVVALMAVQYVDNPLGDYDEGVVASIVRPAGSGDRDLVSSLRDLLRGRQGLFVHHMPVSQAFTREAGERIWGFPKTVDELDVRIARRRAGLRWTRDDGEVVELVVPRGGHLALPGQTACTYTLHDGVVWRTRLQLRGRGLRVGPGGARVRLGHHPIAERVRQWGVGGRALASAWVEHATMDFAAAEPLR